MASEPTVISTEPTNAEYRLDKPIQIVIPFHSPLLQITKHLHFPAPKYKLLNVKTNSAAVLVYTDSGPEAYTFRGGPCENIEKSCQKAAQNAVLDFMKRFNVWVEDISIFRWRELDRCGALYKLKRQELRYVSKGVVGLPLIEKMDIGVPMGSIPIIVDYTAILQLIVKKCNIESSDLEIVSHGRSKYTAWMTIAYPRALCRRKTFYSICCDRIKYAKNSLAKTVIEYLIPIYNLEIIDANYSPKLTAYAAILCALEMESYVASKERMLGIELATAMRRMLPIKSTNKKTAAAPKPPSMIYVPTPPPNNPLSSATMSGSVKIKMQSGKRKKFEIPGELSTVVKQPKHIYTS